MPAATKPQIYTLIPKVMADIGVIGKDRDNNYQNYKFRGIDDVYNAVSPAMVKHGIFVVPEVLSVTEEHVSTSTGKSSFSVRMDVKHTFYAPDGSSVAATTRGEAMDPGDRATSQAHTDAYKQAVFKVFCIPTEGAAADPENESHERGPAPQTVDQAKAALLSAVRKAYREQDGAARRRILAANNGKRIASMEEVQAVRNQLLAPAEVA